MIFFSVGLPSRFGEWCDAVTARLVEQALGQAEAIYADTLEQFAIAVAKTGSPYLVIISRQAVGSLWATLAHANRGFVVALDDPRDALENLVVRHGLDFVQATRVVAKSCASVVSCAAVPKALVLRADRAGTDPVATASTIAHHLGLTISEAHIKNIIQALANLGIWPRKEEDDSWWDCLEEWQRGLVIGAIDPYVARFVGTDLGPITWERELFFINEEQNEEQRQPASRPVDITGRPRFVVYGPDITLPPGSWSATVALGFSDEAAEMSYIVDICAGTQLVQTRIEPARQRFIEANLNFSITAPDMVVVRIWNERAAFDGRLALGHVTMTPHMSLRPETRNYFAIALGE